jgi:subtilisin family serine protease
MRRRRAVVLVLSAVAAAVLIGAVARAGNAAGTVSWQAAALDLPLAWQVTTGSVSSVVAVVDSGVQADHPALHGNVLAGYDFVHGDTNTSDDNGHGTAAAGIVASVCPACRILPVKVLGAERTGSWPTVADGVRWAADHGAQVINLSVGAPRALDVLGAAVEYALTKGVVVVAAAGNDGENESFYPALYPGVVSVAGVDQSGARSSWSNFGSWVTVAAPGCATTAWSGGGYVSDFCGTSTAAPFVAGLAGLARAFDPKLTPAAFAAALATSTTPLPDPGTAASGLPDANRLLLGLGAPSAAPVDDSPPVVPRAPRSGRRLVARIGAWRGAASYRIEWQRSADGTRWEGVVTGASYTPRPRDGGFRLRVVVTAVNARGSTTAASPPSGPVLR